MDTTWAVRQQLFPVEVAGVDIIPTVAGVTVGCPQTGGLCPVLFGVQKKVYRWARGVEL